MSAKSVDAARLAGFIEKLFMKLGTDRERAVLVADSLVRADLEGVTSHGVLLLPMYVGRIEAGGISLTGRPEITDDLGGLVVMSANHCLGQISSAMATDLAIERARIHGVATVAVRHAAHFGAGAYWARRAAAQGMVGMAFCNTRPLMPSPGGAQSLVGNNPLCIAFPSAQGTPLIVDMATSASAVGKIRLAMLNGKDIPVGWATDSEGKDTTSPAEALKGMLLPAAGPKGFGLAVAIDLLCGAISGGSLSTSVRPLYGTLSDFYDCAHTFMVIDASRLNKGRGITEEVDALANAIRSSKKAPGSQHVYAPGDLERERSRQNNGFCRLSPELAHEMAALAKRFDIESPIAP